MFGLGVWEIAVILVVALLVLGPEKLPDAAKTLGKALRDFRNAGDSIKREMLGEIDNHSHPRPVALQPPANSVAQTTATPSVPSDGKDPTKT